MLARSRQPERLVDTRQEKRKEGQGAASQGNARIRNRALALLRDCKPARRSSASRRREVFACLGLLTAIPVLYVANVRRGRRPPATSFARVEARAREECAACRRQLSAKSSGKSPCCRDIKRAEYLGRYRSQGAGLVPLDPRRLPRCSIGHLFHRRPQGAAAWPITCGTKRRNGRQSSIRTSSAASSGRYHRLRDTMALGGGRSARNSGKIRLEGNPTLRRRRRHAFQFATNPSAGPRGKDRICFH